MREWIRSKQWEIFKKQEHEKAKANFRDHVSTAVPNRETVMQGWVLYQQILSKSANKIDEVNLFAHLPHVMNALQGNYADTTPASLAHFAFGLATFEPISGDAGVLLAGLTGENLQKARDFCQAMNNVGWIAGDLDQMYPLNPRE